DLNLRCAYEVIARRELQPVERHVDIADGASEGHACSGNATARRKGQAGVAVQSEQTIARTQRDLSICRSAVDVGYRNLIGIRSRENQLAVCDRSLRAGNGVDRRIVDGIYHDEKELAQKALTAIRRAAVIFEGNYHSGKSVSVSRGCVSQCARQTDG